MPLSYDVELLVAASLNPNINYIYHSLLVTNLICLILDNGANSVLWSQAHN
jgi:hypothetical protein